MNNLKIHVLHITNSYGGTEVYSNLIIALDKLGIQQTIFVPLNSKNHKRIDGKQLHFTVSDSIIIYSTALKKYHKFLYRKKINTILNEVEKNIDIKNINLIQAGLFCTDGAVAYELHKKFQIPYIVAVRNTDVNTYYKKMFWERSYFYSILENSAYIIFLSPKYKLTFLNLLNNKNIDIINEKSIVIPNGVDSLYLENRIKLVKKINSPIRFVFAGAFNRGKNIHKVISALDKLKEKGFNIHFSIIGKGLMYRNEDDNYVRKILELEKNRDWIDVFESKARNELIKIFEYSDIFVMPSIPETFGLVYVEALSQGLPIIYANGQGFDGYYNDRNIGYGVNPSDTKDISEKLELIINNFEKLSLNITKLNLEEDFSWKNISFFYLKLYKKILFQ